MSLARYKTVIDALLGYISSTNTCPRTVVNAEGQRTTLTGITRWLHNAGLDVILFETESGSDVVFNVAFKARSLPLSVRCGRYSLADATIRLPIRSGQRMYSGAIWRSDS